ncbi:MAG: hypothetical protein ACI8P0_006330 [Planctomycetaceae bacterium]|jgi:hypothetical protein
MENPNAVSNGHAISGDAEILSNPTASFIRVAHAASYENAQARVEQFAPSG